MEKMFQCMCAEIDRDERNCFRRRPWLLLPWQCYVAFFSSTDMQEEGGMESGLLRVGWGSSTKGIGLKENYVMLWGTI